MHSISVDSRFLLAADRLVNELVNEPYASEADTETAIDQMPVRMCVSKTRVCTSRPIDSTVD